MTAASAKRSSVGIYPPLIADGEPPRRFVPDDSTAVGARYPVSAVDVRGRQVVDSDREANEMVRKAFRMKVHAGAEQEYERRHRPIWKDLEETLLDHGVLTYSIYLDPETDD